MGRRIYIHQDSLKNLIEREPLVGRVLYEALLRTKTGKMIHSHIIEDGRGLGRIDNEKIPAIEGLLKQRFDSAITHVLRQLGFRIPAPQLRKNIELVLAPDEKVVASCYEDGYFTFATSEDAATIMYDDNEKMSVLREKIREGLTSDLTIIKGRNLVLIRPGAGAGIGKAELYNDVFARMSSVPNNQLASLHKECSSLIAEELTSLFESETGNAFIAEALKSIEEALQDNLFV